jgi:hypothetical protein
MDLSNFTLFAAAGSLVAFWGQVKGFLTRIISIVVKTDTIQGSFLAEEFLTEILPHTRLISWGNNTYLNETFLFPKCGFYAHLFYSYFRSYPAFYKWTPIIISEDGEYSLKITYLTWTFPIHEILESINAKCWDRQSVAAQKRRNFYVYDVSGSDDCKHLAADMAAKSGEPSSGPSAKGMLSRPYLVRDKVRFFGHQFAETQAVEAASENDSYFWSIEAKQLDNEITFWLNNRNWYRERNLPWRRGGLITGKPGGGKSKLVLKCAEKHGLTVRRLNIANMSNTEFLKAFDCSSDEGQIILIEDIDAIFEGRTNVLAAGTHTKQLLSFDTFINAIGGIKAANGSFIIVTSNHPEKLDGALKRAGRLDAKIEIGPLCEDGRKFIAANILRDWQDLIDKAVEEGECMVAAEFENYCIELAIQEKNKEHERNQ